MLDDRLLVMAVSSFLATTDVGGIGILFKEDGVGEKIEEIPNKLRHTYIINVLKVQDKSTMAKLVELCPIIAS
jgi:hypothetical protein